jgi:hypothetical protein
MSIKRITDDLAELRAQVGAVSEVVNKIAEQLRLAANRDEPPAMFTIKQFCKRNAISERQYFKLQREGRGPRTMSTGTVSLRISRQAEIDWIADREAERRPKASAA